MASWAHEFVWHVDAGLRRAAVPDDAPAMAAYMRDQFPFLGVRAPARRSTQRAVLLEVRREVGDPTGADLLGAAEQLWERDEREFQYAGADLLAWKPRLLAATDLPRLRHLLTHRAWWDTVDILAPKVVGAIARSEPDQVVPVLDASVRDDDRWLVRTALLHQLSWKQDTDVERLERYCLLAAGHPTQADEFFVRKAIGWALRQYSSVDPDRVERFVAEHADVLSGLSRREALKAIERRRAQT